MENRNRSVFQPEQGPSFAAESARSDDERSEALPAENSIRGPGFGSLVHDVLERIRFGEVGAAAAPENLLKENTSARLLIDERVDWYLPELASRLEVRSIRALTKPLTGSRLFGVEGRPPPS